ncbi:MAG TPA: hypothetical protein VFL96_16815 [Acidobacteriaceae bacterium]|nr:hypothetical protein [Acidobacteriaceae bacterium]
MKCANDLCDTESLYFRGGSLHAIDVVLDETEAGKPAFKQKMVWLCERCTKLFTIQNWRPPGEQLRTLRTQVGPPARAA